MVSKRNSRAQVRLTFCERIPINTAQAANGTFCAISKRKPFQTMGLRGINYNKPVVLETRSEGAQDGSFVCWSSHDVKAKRSS
jgi:hypothetical protein